MTLTEKFLQAYNQRDDLLFDECLDSILDRECQVYDTEQIAISCKNVQIDINSNNNIKLKIDDKDIDKLVYVSMYWVPGEVAKLVIEKVII